MRVNHEVSKFKIRFEFCFSLLFLQQSVIIHTIILIYAITKHLRLLNRTLEPGGGTVSIVIGRARCETHRSSRFPRDQQLVILCVIRFIIRDNRYVKSIVVFFVFFHHVYK